MQNYDDNSREVQIVLKEISWFDKQQLFLTSNSPMDWFQICGLWTPVAGIL